MNAASAEGIFWQTGIILKRMVVYLPEADQASLHVPGSLSTARPTFHLAVAPCKRQGVKHAEQIAGCALHDRLGVVSLVSTYPVLV